MVSVRIFENRPFYRLAKNSDAPMANPPRLFKYEQFSVRSLQNLKNQVIYFGSPLNFNDPYDCALAPKIKLPSEEDIAKFRQQYRSDSRVSKAGREKFDKRTDKELRELVLRIGLKTLPGKIANFLAVNGVSCFSEVNDSLLMWSHYAAGGRGFCLGFRTDSSLFEKLHQVRYAKHIPEVDFVSLICDDDDQFIDLYRTKAEVWRYEKEWRCIHIEAGKEFGYDSEALTDVYFGANMPFAQIEIISMVLAGQNKTVRLWRGVRSEAEFKVDFHRCVYATFLEAQSRE